MAETDQIIVRDLTKTYRVPVRKSGLMAALSGLVKRQYDQVQAVEGLDFSIAKGEMVALLGPNGAGKTTTLKMLAGLLYPTRGHATVDGFVPWERRNDYLRRISMLLGNKRQMLWDIPPLDTFEVLAEIYGLERPQFKATLDELVALLEMDDLLTRPVRNLSLGERMKCELTAALLHRPAILFLDEPTLGLDVSMQRRVRNFVADYNRRHQVTVILTSHYMADVVALCSRVILIHHGRLLYDGQLDKLAQDLAPYKQVRITLGGDQASGADCLDLPKGTDLISCDGGHVALRVARAETAAVTAHMLRTWQVVDLTVEEPPMEVVIDRVYQEGQR